MTQTPKSFGKMAYCLGESGRNRDVSEDSRLYFRLSAEWLYLSGLTIRLWLDTLALEERKDVSSSTFSGQI